ncbi:MAG: dethiobiotin synthase [Vampirovibrionia bacterium]
MNIFVTGTDTGSGKTVVTAGLATVLQCLGYTVGVYKPIQVGASVINGSIASQDLDFVLQMDENIFTKSTYLLKTDAVPLVSAPLDNEIIDYNTIVRDYNFLADQCDFVIVDGSGGISDPVTPSITVKDLINILELPALVVAKPDKGTINHSILTVEYAKKYNIDLLGIVVSNYPQGTENRAIKTAPQIIYNFANTDLLGVLPSIKNLKTELVPDLLIEAVIQNLNLEKIFRTKFPKL